METMHTVIPAEDMESVAFFDGLGFGKSPAPQQGLEADSDPAPGSPAYAARIAAMVAEPEEIPGSTPGEAADTKPVDEKPQAASEEDYSKVLAETGLNVYEQREIATAARDIGIDPDQAGKLVEWHQEREAKQALRFREMSEQELRADWGSAYETNVQAAQQAIGLVETRFGLGRGELHALLAGPAGNDPRVIRMFAKIAKRL